MNMSAKDGKARKNAIKKEEERISNHFLTVFTVALFAEVVLIFIYSAYKSNPYRPLLGRTVAIAGLISVIGYFVVKVLNKRGIFPNKEKAKNWNTLLLVAGLLSMFAGSYFPILDLGKLLKMGTLANAINEKLMYVTGKYGILGIMYAIVVYVALVFITDSIKIKRLKK